MGGPAWLSIFGFGKATTREHIHSDLRPRSNATKGKKRRHPSGKSTSRRLAALLAPYRPMRLCASLAPCQLPQIALARSPPIYEMPSSSFIAAAAAWRIFGRDRRTLPQTHCLLRKSCGFLNTLEVIESSSCKIENGTGGTLRLRRSQRR